MQSSSTVVVAWGLLLGGLCCCVTAAAIDCPSDVIRLACTKVPTSITLQVGKSYELGPGVFLLNETVEVPAGALCVAGQDRVGAPAGVTRLLSPEGAKQLHFTQYGGMLKINNLQLQGRAGSGGGGGVVIKQSKDGTDDNQPATFIARLVTFKSISPRAVANDDDTAANLTFTNCAFLDNVYDTYSCEDIRGWLCYWLGPPGAAGVTTASNATFQGSTVFRRNHWGALYVASPVTVAFEGRLVVEDSTKRLSLNDDVAEYGGIASPDGAGLIASGGGHLLFSGAVVFRNNTGFGGCGMHLRGATATFASSRTVQFIGNRGTYGAALKAQQSNIQFNGPVLAADNIANAGAGGAFHLVLSNVTFSARATLRNNSLDGCRDEWYFDEGCGGGAMFVRDSQVTHAERAAYLRNTASGADGGAVYIFGLSFGSDSLNSSLLATKVVTFNGNSATRAGGAVWMANAVTFAGGANFLSNSASQEESSGSGGAVHVNPGGALAFGGPATFRNNIASTGGAVTLRGSMSFANNKSRSCWVGNSASVTTGGGALHIEANGRALFGMLAPHNFGPNRGGPLTDRTELDIKVLAGGSYVCDSGQGAGDYNVEGNLCAASCRMRQSCKCPAGQVFAAKQCSCQREV